MANYNGARRKTTVENRNIKSQSTATGAKNKNYYTQNSVSDGWGSSGGRSSRSTNDDGWGDIGRKPSGYSSDDLWGPLPSQPAVVENAWERRGSKKSQKSQSNQGKKPVPLVGPNFSWEEEDYPALESRPPPVENVWEKRKQKLEGRLAMEPTNMTEEELMIQKAIELSKREAKEEEERRRQIEEEYLLQNAILATNPTLFSEFLTPDELAEANKSERTESQFKENGYPEKGSIWDCPEPVESQWSQKQTKKPSKKKKRDKPQSSAYMEEEITSPNSWPDSQKFDHDERNKTALPEQAKYQETEDNWSQNPIGKNYHSEESEPQFMGQDSDYSTTQPISATSPDIDGDNKLDKSIQPKISKVIDMFGGWGSKNTQNSSLASSHKKERFDSYNDFSSTNSVSNDDEVFQDNWGKSKEISDLDGNLQCSDNSSKFRKAESFSTNEKCQSSHNEDSWDTTVSSNDKP